MSGFAVEAVAAMAEAAEAAYREGSAPSCEVRGLPGSPPPWVRLGEVRCGRMSGGVFEVERVVGASARRPAAAAAMRERQTNCRAVVVGGTRYASCAEAAQALGTTSYTVSRRARDRMTVDGVSYRHAEGEALR